jgi:hypothetical protein
MLLYAVKAVRPPAAAVRAGLLFRRVLSVSWAHSDDVCRVERYRLAGPGLGQTGEGPGAAAYGVFKCLDDPVERCIDLELGSGGQEELGGRH